ncbi:Fur family transcriptional regulator [Fusibacter bizertensis]|jgi:Fe2+/Zn2+ uptake regulation proteins|uniref:Fur family transcriptional regulator n=1 Tax=Fusibacter bizertensis TaxID=1488331 RepID=A0ABT6NBT3_9FIRM|nr:Fur family transcriptional regulator [Fusibacter bizertensis]MDH8677878.1 Fur family transcriptional regulator [Fusibacter bizertensis]
MNDVGDFLKTNGIKPSYQRIKIYEYLMQNKDHPTVESIYNALNGQIPTLSKTTVYNTLKIFIDRGIAMAITIDDNEVRFDAFVETHGHFKCQHCHQVYDFNVNFEGAVGDQLDDFDILEQQMFFYGICKNCREES